MNGPSAASPRRASSGRCVWCSPSPRRWSARGRPAAGSRGGMCTRAARPGRVEGAAWPAGTGSTGSSAGAARWRQRQKAGSCFWMAGCLPGHSVSSGARVWAGRARGAHLRAELSPTGALSGIAAAQEPCRAAGQACGALRGRPGWREAAELRRATPRRALRALERLGRRVLGLNARVSRRQHLDQVGYFLQAQGLRHGLPPLLQPQQHQLRAVQVVRCLGVLAHLVSHAFRPANCTGRHQNHSRCQETRPHPASTRCATAARRATGQLVRLVMSERRPVPLPPF